jgi:survival of motor neuron protein-interacting protein 1
VQLGVRRQLHSAMREAVRCGEVGPQAAARLYALSARVERPLHADTCALYRQLLRACAGQRAALGKDGAADPRLPHLNILLVLAGAFFGQDEELAAMWDDEE